MSEASATEDSTTNDPNTEPTATEETDLPKSEKEVDSGKNDTSEPSASRHESDDSKVLDSSVNNSDENTSSAPSSEESTDADDWTAAMAEQASATANVAKSDNSSNEETAPVFEEFSKEGGLTNAKNDIDMILDIPVQLTVELGRTKIAIKNLMQLAQGSVVELDGMAGEPMDVLVNGCLIAQGEVVVVNDKFGVRLTDIITPSERIRKLNR